MMMRRRNPQPQCPSGFDRDLSAAIDGIPTPTDSQVTVAGLW
jgi:hypothetical protein